MLVLLVVCLMVLCLSDCRIASCESMWFVYLLLRLRINFLNFDSEVRKLVVDSVVGGG